MRKEEALTISSISKVWPFILTGASVIVSLTLMTAQLNARIDLVDQKIDMVVKALEELKDDRASSLDRMREAVAKRDDRISQVELDMTTVKTILKLP